MNAISLNSRGRRWLFAVLWMFLAGILAHGSGLRFNPTPSLPKGVYRLASGQDVAKGDFVSFCLQGEFADLAKERGYLQAGSCPNGLRPLLKRLAGLPGDYIEDGSLTIRSVDSQGRPMPSVLASGVIPSGMALVFLVAAGFAMPVVLLFRRLFRDKQPIAIPFLPFLACGCSVATLAELFL